MNLKGRMGLMRTLLSTILGLLFITFSTNVFASEASLSATYSATMIPIENDIGQSQLHPASPLYFLKAVRESVEFKMAFTPRVKIIRQLEFATRRLREVKSLISVKREDLIAATMEQYWYYLNSLPQADLKDEEVAIRIKESLVIHLQTLEQIYQKVSDNHAKIAIRSIVNRITKRVDLPVEAKSLACSFLAKEASSSALTEPEREILMERAQRCYQPILR